ncbi:MAG: type I restriction enzyme HsdR N-terminal domain-containing protein [Prevotellaceae bacterium]|jgi:hypothetical protein|nr:type I restriction enzyme HsdR N-terminal domain-containing protein [Prevotellaceae bacterium]
MLQLNLPAYDFTLRKTQGKVFIFDSQRKRYVRLTPEEWVRQHFIRFLILQKNYPAALLAIETQLEINGLKKRCDAVLYNRTGNPQLIIEFKAPEIRINQAIFDQVAVYNSKLNVDCFLISNGLEHYFCRTDKNNSRYIIDSRIPDYEEFTTQENNRFSEHLGKWTPNLNNL